MNELVSIVIPVYNVAKYVRNCLQSIASQDYENFEVIVVDDGSTDDSLKICKDFIEQLQDYRFKLLHKDNGGLADARNYGISHCSHESKYVVFVDSDDEITSDCISQLLKHANDDNLVIGSMLRCPSHPGYNKSISRGEPQYFNEIWHCRNFLESLKFGIINSVCARCYSLYVIRKHHLLFEKTLPEDTLFNIAYLKKVNSVVLLNREIYYYFIRSQSMSTNPKECIYENYIRIQHSLYDLVEKDKHKYIDQFVYPQYRQNTALYISKGEYDIPRHYLSKRLVRKSFKSYKMVSMGDLIAHSLLRFQLFRTYKMIFGNAH